MMQAMTAAAARADVSDRTTYEVRRVVRRHVAAEVTSAKLAEVTEIARRMSRARTDYLREYWHPRYVSQVLKADRRLVEARRHTGWADEGLSPHQNKVSLESALAMLRAKWGATLERASKKLGERADLSDAERHWCYSALLRPDVLQACLERRQVRIAATWAAGVDTQRCAGIVRRLVLRARPRDPSTTARLWFDVDTNLYRAFSRPEDRYFRGAWVALTGLSRGKRIALPLRGSDIGAFASRTGKPESRPNLRIHVSSGRVVLVLSERIVVTRRTTGPTVGVDKGLGTLVTASSGDHATARFYGTQFHSTLGALSDDAIPRERQRGRLRAYARSLRNTQPEKARRMRRRNLRSSRARGVRERTGATLRGAVNQALNSFLADHADVARIVVESLDVRRQRFSRRMNRHIAKWLSGYLHERLAYKAELNGVELQVVNAAYSSQSCPRCWYTSKTNRRGERFTCGHCGLTGSADAVAATNLLRRGSDTAITRYTPRSDVYQILEARWRSARTGRAWGSNEGTPLLTWAEGAVPARAANNRVEPVDGTSGPDGSALSPALTASAKP